MRIQLEHPFGKRYRSNFYGYSTLVWALERELPAVGVEIVEDAETVLHCIAPMAFEPVPGKRNILLTMFESPDLPHGAVEKLRAADALLVPSRFCDNLFRDAVPEIPVYLTPLGVDQVPYTRRTWDGRHPFRWLWVGALNIRKGWQTIAYTWERYMQDVPAECYIKTTRIRGEGLVERPRPQLIVDTRDLPREELAALYGSAHGFVYPTLGEGFGLTLAEAMSSGLPSVATGWSGHLEFANAGNCRLLPYKLKRLQPDERLVSNAADQLYEFATVNPEQLGKAMLEVMRDYRAAAEMGRQAHRDLRRYTWRASARSVRRALERHAELRRAA